LKNLRVYSISQKLKKAEVHKLVKSLSSDLDFSVSNLEINFISERSILDINKTYLKHHYTTDIITFDYSDAEKIIDGEIFISMDDAFSNSKKFKVPYSEELTRLIIHGILHLLGYDDRTITDKKIMKRLENKLLSRNIFSLL
jgi:rRNA maturation RNase YbeY